MSNNEQNAPFQLGLSSTHTDTAHDLLPMRDVARLTGVNPITLRAWERRYGLIQPTRTEGGHRLYSMTDVQTIQKIRTWTDRGVAVSKVAALLAAEAGQYADHAPADLALQASPETTGWREWQTLMHQAILRFDDKALERYYGQLFSTYPLQQIVQQVMMPLWHELLQQSQCGQHSQWVFYDDFLRSRFQQRLRCTRQSHRDGIVFMMLENQGFELEVLACALVFDNHQGRVRVLPPQQRLNELPLLCQSITPQAVVLFSSTPLTDALLGKLRRVALSIDSPVAVAGIAAELATDTLRHSPFINLGAEPVLMASKLEQYLAGRLDT